MRCRNEVKSGVIILAGKWPARKRRTWKNIKEGCSAMMMATMMMIKMVEMLVMMIKKTQPIPTHTVERLRVLRKHARHALDEQIPA